jgi:enamine deaminase RidA (YjgF/YER057c/UK114 family)
MTGIGLSKRIINPPSLVAPRGFSHGVATSGGTLLFLAGQDASDATGRLVSPGDLVGQMAQVLENLQAVVAAAGGGMRDIVQLTIFVRDRADYLAKRKPLGAIFRSHFDGYYPAMALFEVNGFYQAEALIEAQGIAVVPTAA